LANCWRGICALCYGSAKEIWSAMFENSKFKIQNPNKFQVSNSNGRAVLRKIGLEFERGILFGIWDLGLGI
jgi:hypothetical protein